MRSLPPTALAIAAVVMMSLMPTSWVASFAGDLSSILWVPLSPISHAATAARVWMRPQPVAASEGEQKLIEERDYYRGLWHSQLQRVKELEQRIGQYEMTAAMAPGAHADPMVAVDVLSRTGGSGSTSLKINAGRRSGIAAGDVVVIPGDAIVGRIASEVGEITSFVSCLANSGGGRIDAIIIPASQERSKNPRGVPVQLAPDSGALRGDIELAGEARAGDVVRLADRTWPPGAQGLRIGIVTEVRRKDSQPLRGEVVVVPIVDSATVGSLIVKLTQGGER